MNTAETNVNPAGFTGADGAVKLSICWNDWFHFDEAQQKCVFRSTNNVAQANSTVSMVQTVNEVQA